MNIVPPPKPIAYAFRFCPYGSGLGHRGARASPCVVCKGTGGLRVPSADKYEDFDLTLVPLASRYPNEGTPDD